MKKSKIALFSGTISIVGMILLLNGHIPTTISKNLELKINTYLYCLNEDRKKQSVKWVDRVLLRLSVNCGLAVSWFKYPEASKMLYHYIYGDGKALTLNSQYFSNSEFLQKIVVKFGSGTHGPIGMIQEDDYRLSLALNPFFLTVLVDSVIIFHPEVDFVQPNSPDAYTIVKVFGLQLKVFDGLVSILEGKPYYVSSVWSVN